MCVELCIKQVHITELSRLLRISVHTNMWLVFNVPLPARYFIIPAANIIQRIYTMFMQTGKSPVRLHGSVICPELSLFTNALLSKCFINLKTNFS